ncbi:AEC family transporter [Halalkalibacter oceani]|uniref:AEC family transporter n=1 Tax=Halalkalibacter oceani TaxID=1653776 RepID=UPI003398D381
MGYEEVVDILSIVLPIFIIFACGFFLKKKFNGDIRTLSNISFNCLLPALVFKNFYSSTISGDIGWLVLFEVVLLLAIIVISIILARCFRFNKERETGLLLVASFPNAGNYGSSIILLAYGQEGFQWAIAFFVIQSMMMNSLGVLFAAQDKGGIGDTLKKLLKMPVLYAGLLGFLCQSLTIELHPIVYHPIEMLSQAMIPMLMLLLGMQLATIKRFSFAKGIALGVTIRLVLSPVLAFLLLPFFSFDEVASNVILLQAAMPAAIVPVLLANQYGREPEMVAGITLFSTIVSAGTISLLLWLLH